MEAGTGIEPVYTDLQLNAHMQAFVFKYPNYPNLRCVCECVNPCATPKQVLCVEHCDCA